jgi:hypothetical protein
MINAGGSTLWSANSREIEIIVVSTAAAVAIAEIVTAFDRAQANYSSRKSSPISRSRATRGSGFLSDDSVEGLIDRLLDRAASLNVASRRPTESMPYQTDNQRLAYFIAWIGPARARQTWNQLLLRTRDRSLKHALDLSGIESKGHRRFAGYARSTVDTGVTKLLKLGRRKFGTHRHLKIGIPQLAWRPPSVAPSGKRVIKDSFATLGWLIVASAIVYFVLLSPESRDRLKGFACAAFDQARLLALDFRGYEPDF